MWFFSHTIQMEKYITRRNILRTSNLWFFFHFLWYFPSLRGYFSFLLITWPPFSFLSFFVDKQKKSRSLCANINYAIKFLFLSARKFSTFYQSLIFAVRDRWAKQKFHKLFTFHWYFYAVETRALVSLFRKIFLSQTDIVF